MSRNKRLAIGLGVHKSGTSWLYNQLDLHPEVNLLQRDTHFFNKDKNYSERKSMFKSNVDSSNCLLSIEMSNQYLSSKKALDRIKKDYPDALLFAILRNPVDRLISHIKQDIKTGHLDQRTTISEALLKSDDYVKHGKYKSHIEHLLEHFKREQIHIMLFDDIRLKPVLMLEELSSFLNTSPFVSSVGSKEKYNEARVPKFIKLEQIQNDLYYKLKSNPLGRPLWTLLKKSGLANLVRKLNRKEFEFHYDKEEKAQLRSLFEDDIKFVKEWKVRPKLPW